MKRPHVEPAWRGPAFVSCAMCSAGWIVDTAGFARRCVCWFAYLQKVARETAEANDA